MSQWPDYVFLAVGGFLVGSFISLGLVTIRLEPWAKVGYAVIGAGLVTVNVAQLWLQFHVNASYWFLVVTTLGFSVAAIGLALLAKARKQHQRR